MIKEKKKILIWLIGATLLIATIYFLSRKIKESYFAKSSESTKNNQTVNLPIQTEKSSQQVAENNNQIRNERKDWFTPCHWLTDAEIDWALEQLKEEAEITALSLNESSPYLFLPSMTFFYVYHTRGITEAEADLAFPQLLSELTSFTGQLLFIPVNNPDFHWSLLVYETSSQTFYHYDSLSGTNYEYVKSLVRELLQQILQTNEPSLTKHLIPQHDQIKQINGHDCGVAVITFARKIVNGYAGDLTELDFSDCDLWRERNWWREKVAEEKIV